MFSEKYAKCEICGASLEGTKRAKYCKACADEMKREKARQQYQEQKVGRATKAKEPRYCKRCGVLLVNPSRSRKYCTECAEIEKKDAYTRYWQRKKEENRLKRESKERGKSKAVLSLNEIAKLMKEYGYGGNYGSFVHDYRGKIEGV